MVTARPPQNQPLEEDEDGLNDDNCINVFVPSPKSSSKRRKRIEVEDDESASDNVTNVTPSPKKRKVLPVRAKDGEDKKIPSSRIVVEIPANSMADKTVSDSVEPASTKTNHRRFDSEEPVGDFSTAREQLDHNQDDDEEAAEEEDEDSDDDAPETIGLHDAVQTIKSREKVATRAVKEQISATRRKRKERDEALRKQSESAKKRKSKTTAKAKAAVQSEPDFQQGEPNDDGINGIDSQEDDIPTSIPNNRELPNLLPLEYLEDDDPSEVVAVEEQPIKASRKKKFKDLSEKNPKDRRIGGTTYRVTKAQSTNLAPKAAHNARSVKESWLQGRLATKNNPARKPFSAASRGFFK